jgi:hypothetical protein
VDAASENFGIPKELWHVWDTSLSLSKIGSRIPLSDAVVGQFDEEASQAVRIMAGDPKKGGESKLLVEHDYALMKSLSVLKYYGLRVYVHIPEDRPNIRSEIEEFFKQRLPNFPFYP